MNDLIEELKYQIADLYYSRNDDDDAEFRNEWVDGQSIVELRITLDRMQKGENLPFRINATINPTKTHRTHKADRSSKLTVDQRFEYNPEQGTIVDIFRPAFSVVNWATMRGYATVHHGGKTILAHRLAWRLQTGQWPEIAVYFLDGDKSNLKWANLSLKRTTAPKKRFQAQTRSEGKVISLGYFSSREEAQEAIKFFKQIS